MVKLKKIVRDLFTDLSNQPISNLTKPIPYERFFIVPKLIQNTINKNLVPLLSSSLNEPVPLPFVMGTLGVGSFIFGVSFFYAKRKKIKGEKK